MRAVVTRVKRASVDIEGKRISEIGQGLLVLLGVHKDDTEAEARVIADKICKLRIFEDESGKMNRSPADVSAEILIVSQFTLFADCRSRRPGFTSAARADIASPLCDLVTQLCRDVGFPTKTGEFGADMQVESVNDGPVTILLDTSELR